MFGDYFFVVVMHLAIMGAGIFSTLGFVFSRLPMPITELAVSIFVIFMMVRSTKGLLGVKEGHSEGMA